ncbi:Crp/Fnr family transcriptional regulator [Sneathiella sp.]|uniref:Crp/Fnr family transcriptional regulator n=1 Tax=Sneathiella sp. TaxID=1964365 RepID=UPI00356B1862
MKRNEQDLALQVLREAAWLKDYPPKLAESLVTEGRLMRLNIGEWAQAEGDDRNGLFVVIDGLLHSYYAALDDRMTMIGFAEPGSVLGHATRYSGGPRLVTAVCAEPSTLLEISESALDRVAERSPEIWRAIAGFAYAAMRSTLQMAADVISLRPRERIAARLLATARGDQSDKAPVIKISQEMLGEMIGVTRKTVNFHLSVFERDGLIRVGYGRIELCDLSGLQEIANG